MTQAGKARTRAAVQLVSAAADDEQGGSRSVRRALEMCEFLLQKGEPATVGAIVAALQIPKSTAYELVRTLTEAGYLEPSGRGAGLFLGRKLFELGMAYRGQVDLLRDGSQIVEELRDNVPAKLGDVEVHFAPGEGHRFVLRLRGPDLSPEVHDTDPQETGVPPLPARAMRSRRSCAR